MLSRPRSAPLELLRSPRRLPVAGSDYVTIPCTLSLTANDSIPVRKSTSRLTRREGGGRRRGARRLRSGNVKDTIAHSGPVDVDGTAEERAKDVVVRGFKPHTFVGMLREAIDDHVRPASDG